MLVFVNGIFYFCGPIVNVQTIILRFLKLIKTYFGDENNGETRCTGDNRPGPVI